VARVTEHGRGGGGDDRVYQGRFGEVLELAVLAQCGIAFCGVQRWI